ncbi:hypothetical protein KY329_05060 [Candidatus Woesearchaeota archaeon]|nr:hypothetical protein [Candidatus Woesearchaeota archaeon]
MRKYLAWFLCMLLLASTVSALYGISYDSYGGQAARERRAFWDPYSRENYFPIDYVNTFGGFGSKGPVTGTVANTGSKSAYSGLFNLDTSEFWRQGRNPSRISNWDPNVRGFARLDTPVELHPPGYDTTQIVYPSGDTVYHEAEGTARILSLSNVVNSAFYDRPQGAVYMKIRGLPVVGEDFRYHAWLYDSELDFWQSMGTLDVRGQISSTASHEWSIFRPIWMYDWIFVTREPFPDENPGPSEEVVLEGAIDKPRSALFTQGYLPGVTIR